MKKELILFSGLYPDTPKGRDFLDICAHLGIPCRQIQSSQFEKTVGYLLQSAEMETEAAPSSTPEFLLLQGFTNSRLDKLLLALQKKGISIECKAVVTPHNKNWTISQLLTEMDTERALFSAYKQLKQTVSRLEANAKESSAPSALAEELKKAKALMRSGNFTAEELAAAERRCLEFT